MAIDKAVDSTVLDGMFTDIANAIREKNGETAQYTPGEMPAAIAGLPTGLTVTRGTVSGSGSKKYISTGLRTITYFLLFPNGTPANKQGAHIFLYDGIDNRKWRVDFASAGLESTDQMYSTFIISGGTAQLGSDSTTYLQSGLSYTWIAMGS